MKVKVKHSLRMKLTLMLLSLTTGIFMIYLLLNQFFLEDYYVETKKKSLLKGYETIDEILEDETRITTDIANEIASVCEKFGITIIIVDTTDNTEFQYGNGNILKVRLQQINFGWNTEEANIIKKTDSYILQGYNLNSSGESGYLELTGVFKHDMIFLMRMAVESIHESANISMKFFIIVGWCVMLVGCIIAFFMSGQFTKPILRLVNISKEMSKLNFNVKYDVESDDELGILGGSMNELSDKLEETIIELKQANYELQNDIAQKEKIDEMRKDFISNVSHELKTPIALIQGYAEGLTECVNDDEQSREFYCNVIMDEADKMNKMVKNLLSLNQLESGGNTLQYEKFELNMVISGIVSSLDYLLKQENIQVDFCPKEDIYVYADEFKMEEVVTNYLTNAIHYAKGEKQIRISEEKIGKRVRISVFNTGDQIPQEELDNIWGKFYKVDKARTREYGGSGIGLSIVKAIMNAHGTECGVNNLENGVEFWFELDMELV